MGGRNLTFTDAISVGFTVIGLGFAFQTLLHQAIGDGFQGRVIPVRLFPYPFDGFLVTMYVEHLVQPKQVIRIASAP